MLSKLKKTNNQGFTIIEVMIVLAVAAMILLIVLFAIPVLQRNSRNTGIKSDASSVAGALNTYQSDNNGTAATQISSASGTITLGVGTGPCVGAISNPETIKIQGSTKVTCSAAVPAYSATVPGAGNIIVVPSQTCPAALGGSGQTSTRSYAVFYATETSSTTLPQCLDS